MPIPPSVDFPKADPLPRGCGERTPGGVYIECGLSPAGRPFEDFLLDPPQPLPPGLSQDSLANKPQLWEDPSTHAVHVVIWVGREHYAYLPDFIEEARRHGISRKVSPRLLDRPDFRRLDWRSRLILAHPLTINTRWQDQAPPLACRKGVAGHALPTAVIPDVDVAPVPPTNDHPQHAGPCLWKNWELMPEDAAIALKDPASGASILNPLTKQPQRKGLMLGTRAHFYRQIGSTEYLFAPTGESADGLAAGIVGVFPITGFALIQRADGTVDPRADTVLERLWQEADLPFYHADR